MSWLFFGVVLLGFGMLYLFSLPKVPAHQKNLMIALTGINVIAGVVILTMVMLGNLK